MNSIDYGDNPDIKKAMAEFSAEEKTDKPNNEETETGQNPPKDKEPLDNPAVGEDNGKNPEQDDDRGKQNSPKKERGDEEKMEHIRRMKLGTESQKLQEEKAEKKEMAATIVKIIKHSQFIESARSLAASFRERNSQSFNPLISPDAAGRISSAANELENLNPQNANLEDAEKAITSIMNALRTVGEIPRGRSLKDDPESIKKVSFKILSLFETSGGLRRSLGTLEKSETEGINNRLTALESALKDKRNLVILKEKMLRDYQGRR